MKAPNYKAIYNVQTPGPRSKLFSDTHIFYAPNEILAKQHAERHTALLNRKYGEHRSNEEIEAYASSEITELEKLSESEIEDIKRKTK